MHPARIVATLVAIAWSGTTHAVDGDIDASFGTNGVALVGVADAPALAGLVMQGDGKVVVCGAYSGGVSQTQDFILARFTSEGGLDSIFGEGGQVTIDFAGGGEATYEDQCTALAIQPDGKIIAAGSSRIFMGPGLWYAFSVARIDAGGMPDASFGDEDGKAFAFLPDALISGAQATAVALQHDGKIVVGGNRWGGTDPVVGNAMALARFNADGSLDPGFGQGGQLVIDFGGYDAYAFDLDVDAQGRIVVSGSRSSDMGTDMAVVRRLPDGSPDPSFGSGGKVVIALDHGGPDGTNVDTAAALELQGDGRIVLAGFADSAGSVPDDRRSDMIVARLMSNGELDTGFGDEGISVLATPTLPEGVDLATAVRQQGDGKLIVAGVVRSATDATLIARMQTDGSLDASFGDGGIVMPRFDLTVPDHSRPTALAFQGDQIIVAGTVEVPSGTDHFAARFRNSIGESIFSDGFE